METKAGLAHASTASCRTILVVEDETFLLAAAAEYLTLVGHNVLRATNPLEAVALLEEHPGNIDAIFTDINMPGEMDGLELARFAKAHRPEILVLLTTGGPHSSLERMDGVDGLFAKPYEIGDVADAIARQVQQHPR